MVIRLSPGYFYQWLWCCFHEKGLPLFCVDKIHSLTAKWSKSTSIFPFCKRTGKIAEIYLLLLQSTWNTSKCKNAWLKGQDSSIKVWLKIQPSITRFIMAYNCSLNFTLAIPKNQDVSHKTLKHLSSWHRPRHCWDLTMGRNQNTGRKSCDNKPCWCSRSSFCNPS